MTDILAVAREFGWIPAVGVLLYLAFKTGFVVMGTEHRAALKDADFWKAQYLALVESSTKALGKRLRS